MSWGTRAFDSFPLISAQYALLLDDLEVIWPKRTEIVDGAQEAENIDATLTEKIQNGALLCESLLDELQGVRDEMLDWIEEVEKITNIWQDLLLLRYSPAFAGTGSTLEDLVESPARTETVRQGDTLETVAQRATGEAEGWTHIDVDPWDEFDTGWTGTILTVPTDPEADYARRKSPPGVWTGAVAAEALGRDIDRSFILNTAGTDLALLPPTLTLFQGLANILDTPKGAIRNNPRYGSHAEAIIGESWQDLAPQVIGIEVKKSFLSDPRVESVSRVQVSGEDDAREIESDFVSVIGEHETLNIGMS